MSAVIRLQGVRKTYGQGAVAQEVLHGIDLTLARGEFAALIGPSGSGKSTLLNLLGLLDRPSAGEVFLLERPTSEMEEAERTRLRGEALGFVFQFHHLLAAFSALENVLLPSLARNGGRLTPTLRVEAEALLASVGLKPEQWRRKPAELSGGQQQRVAIARALFHRPVLLLADEPTGNLDTQTADQVFALFRRFNEERGLTVLVVTHDPRLAARTDRIIELVDGWILADRSAAPHHPAP
ncbi:MAG: ABC transporter ATP-binding protein [Lysobacterales bacterium]|jgi:lipoprotein-releasing system ATP-binding protein|nr:MAG: ABC transporter ATP-binding protein [Xanthomonadales bacterium]